MIAAGLCMSHDVNETVCWTLKQCRLLLQAREQRGLSPERPFVLPSKRIDWGPETTNMLSCHVQCRMKLYLIYAFFCIPFVCLKRYNMFRGKVNFRKTFRFYFFLFNMQRSPPPRPLPQRRLQVRPVQPPRASSSASSASAAASPARGRHGQPADAAAAADAEAGGARPGRDREGEVHPPQLLLVRQRLTPPPGHGHPAQVGSKTPPLVFFFFLAADPCQDGTGYPVYC